MRQEVVLIWILKCKLKNLHARESELISEVDDRLIYLAQVFSYDRHVITKCCFHGGEEVFTRSLKPLSVDSCFISVRNCPELIKTSEVVDPYIISKCKLVSYTVKPPLVTSTFMFFPVIERIAPQLACS